MMSVIGVAAASSRTVLIRKRPSRVTSYCRPLRLRPDEKRGLTAFLLESLSGTIGEGLRPAVK